MIELAAKGAEVEKTSPEINQLPKDFNPDQRIDTSKLKTHDLPDKEGKFDPDKRVDSSKPEEKIYTDGVDSEKLSEDLEYHNSSEINQNVDFDPDKRIDNLKTEKPLNAENNEVSNSNITDKDTSNDNNDGEEEEKKYPPNSTIEMNGQECKTDDNGKIYSRDGELEPNCKYTLNGYNYETDEKRRIIKAEGEISIPENKTPRPKLPDIDDRKDTDDRGHLIAHEFGGSDTEGNLVPMDSDLNESGDYRQLEIELKKAVEEGKDVSVTVEPQYEGDSKRPISFVVTYTIDGETYEKTFPNESSKGDK